jgi:hypothetical protein
VVNDDLSATSPAASSQFEPPDHKEPPR